MLFGAWVLVCRYTECQDITLYLEPMRGLFEEVEETEFDKLHSTYQQILHLCQIIFTKSEYVPGNLATSLR